MNEWINARERLPEKRGMYLTARHKDIFVESWNGVVWTERYQLGQAKYWMPLPEPPEEKDLSN